MDLESGRLPGNTDVPPGGRGCHQPGDGRPSAPALIKAYLYDPPARSRAPNSVSERRDERRHLSKHVSVAGLSDGHGWVRTSDLSL